MKFNLLRLAALCTLAILFHINASAGVLVDNDTFTTDSATGLDWLDISFTRGLSYNQVAHMIDGGSLDGWRFATGVEFDTLIVDAIGGPFTPGYDPGQYLQLVDLVDLVGATYGSTYYGFTVGFVDSTGLSLADARQFGYYDSYGGYVRAPNNTGWDDGFAASHSYRGSFLVRGNTVAVPEPATLALLGLGLLGMTSARRVRRSPPRA